MESGWHDPMEGGKEGCGSLCEYGHSMVGSVKWTAGWLWIWLVELRSREHHHCVVSIDIHCAPSL